MDISQDPQSLQRPSCRDQHQKKKEADEIAIGRQHIKCTGRSLKEILSKAKRQKNGGRRLTDQPQWFWCRISKRFGYGGGPIHC